MLPTICPLRYLYGAGEKNCGLRMLQLSPLCSQQSNSPSFDFPLRDARVRAARYIHAAGVVPVLSCKELRFDLVFHLVLLRLHWICMSIEVYSASYSATLIQGGCHRG